MFSKPLVLGSLGLVLVGCGVTEDNFGYKFAVVTCKKARNCEPDDFEDWYDDLEDCVDDFEPIFDELQDWTEIICDIDYQLASQCYRQLRFASCDDWEDPDWNPEACEDYVVCN
jgi:hypothetical protein